MAITGKVKKFFFPTEKYEISNTKKIPISSEQIPTKNTAQNPQVTFKTTEITKNHERINIEKSNKQQIIANPRAYEDVIKIADELIKGNPVIINIANMEKEDGIRLIDFLAGVSYSLNGDIQRIDQSTFLISAKSTIGDIKKI